MVNEKILRQWITSLETKLTTLNDRTKMHTLDIRELKKRVKELEDERTKM